MRLCQCMPPAFSSTTTRSPRRRRFGCLEQEDDDGHESAPNPEDQDVDDDDTVPEPSTESRLMNQYPKSTNSKNPCHIRNDSCDDDWTWSAFDGSPEAKLYGPRSRTVLFHPGWSNGTAAVRGTKPLIAPHPAFGPFGGGGGGSQTYYWEIDVSHRVFGTSLMFGIGTKRAALHECSFVDLLGRDRYSWGLSHKGRIWHNGQSSQFCEEFAENTPTTIGLLLDWSNGGDGTLAYYKDGKYLGVAFRGLRESLQAILDEQQDQDGGDWEDDLLYPMIASTAARTEMCLASAKRRLTTLQDRCAWQIAKRLRRKAVDVETLGLPETLRQDIRKRVAYLF